MLIEHHEPSSVVILRHDGLEAFTPRAVAVDERGVPMNLNPDTAYAILDTLQTSAYYRGEYSIGLQGTEDDPESFILVFGEPLGIVHSLTQASHLDSINSSQQ
jgi:hypothetical protein